jgi:hypothetical protein
LGLLWQLQVSKECIVGSGYPYTEFCVPHITSLFLMIFASFVTMSLIDMKLFLYHESFQYDCCIAERSSISFWYLFSSSIWKHYLQLDTLFLLYRWW